MQTLASSQELINSDRCNQILCLYTNATSKIQIIKMRNSLDLNLNRVVFPGQRLMFESVPEATLEIYTTEVSKILISCEQLRV